ncbi:MAG: hypothetical protein NT062_33705 [Proteobacteria bacterium]|nr:hypothetical protein [Pseudomonadota bacterium]
MRIVLLVSLAACATTARICPPATTFVTQNPARAVRSSPTVGPERGWFAELLGASLRYCAGGCDAPVMETWRLGAVSYGFDLGIQLRLR